MKTSKLFEFLLLYLAYLFKFALIGYRQGVRTYKFESDKN